MSYLLCRRRGNAPNTVHLVIVIFSVQSMLFLPDRAAVVVTDENVFMAQMGNTWPAHKADWWERICNPFAPNDISD